jgi:hypothetical protein
MKKENLSQLLSKKNWTKKKRNKRLQRVMDRKRRKIERIRRSQVFSKLPKFIKAKLGKVRKTIRK